jgi:hypothetical protein
MAEESRRRMFPLSDDKDDYLPTDTYLPTESYSPTDRTRDNFRSGVGSHSGFRPYAAARGIIRVRAWRHFHSGGVAPSAAKTNTKKTYGTWSVSTSNFIFTSNISYRYTISRPSTPAGQNFTPAPNLFPIPILNSQTPLTTQKCIYIQPVLGLHVRTASIYLSCHYCNSAGSGPGCAGGPAGSTPPFEPLFLISSMLDSSCGPVA